VRETMTRGLTEDSFTVALTGLRNGRYLKYFLEQAPKMAALEAPRPPAAPGHFTFCLFDLDHFKQINDRHGHAAGDAVIERAAQLIRNEVREHDLVARLGGEEFAVLLTGAGALRAHEVAGRIRRNFEFDSGPVPGTLCVGVAERSPGESLAGLMDRADTALLRAKRNGRNRIESAVAS